MAGFQPLKQMQRGPEFTPLQGVSVSIPLPEDVDAASVLVLDHEGAEVSLSIRHREREVVIESDFDMNGLVARLTF